MLFQEIHCQKKCLLFVAQFHVAIISNLFIIITKMLITLSIISSVNSELLRSISTHNFALIDKKELIKQKLLKLCYDKPYSNIS